MAAAVNRLTELLLQAQSPNAGIRSSAEQQLTAAQTHNFPDFLHELAGELLNESSPEIARQLAGLMLKNAVSGTDKKIDKIKREKWIEVPLETAAAIRQKAFETLGSDCEEARRAACQVISKIARVDLPRSVWTDLVANLLKLVVGQHEATQKKGALTTFGYICEDLQVIAEDTPTDGDVLSENDCNQILTGVVTGMKDVDVGIRLAACRALYHVLSFAYKNIENQEERGYLFVAISENLRHADEQIRHSAWECTLQLAVEYYDYLEQFMSELAPLSLEAIQGGSEMTALPAVEFWNDICDEEIAILNGLSTRKSLDFMHQAKGVLLPVLFEVMATQNSEEVESGDWTLAMAAGTCVGLCAEILKDDILDIALEFVTANSGHASWERREAAVFAYGSIMDGPTSARLQPLVQGSFPNLCKSLDDSSPAVRDTTAWTIGRIAKFHFSCISGLLESNESGSGLLNLLLSKLADKPRVSAQICFALHEILDHCGTGAEESSGFRQNLDCHLGLIVDALYRTAMRVDSDECKLRTASYTAIGQVVSNLGGDDKPKIVAQLLEHLIINLVQTTSQPMNDDTSQLQIELCGCLEVCIRESDPGVLQSSLAFPERICTLLTHVTYGSPTPGQGADGHFVLALAAEDALMAFNALAVAMGESFSPLAPMVCEVLHICLLNREAEAICEKCIDMAGDLARALGQKFAEPHGMQILTDLYEALRDKSAKVALKPKIMQAIGDIAFSLGAAFVIHPDFMDFLKEATLTRVEQGPLDSDAWLDFVNKLRESAIWAYEGIFLGVRSSESKVTLLSQYLPTILEFVTVVIGDCASTPQNQLKALELLCDLVAVFPESKTSIQHDRVEFWAKCRALGECGDQATKRQLSILDKLMQAGRV